MQAIFETINRCLKIGNRIFFSRGSKLVVVCSCRTTSRPSRRPLSVCRGRPLCPMQAPTLGHASFIDEITDLTASQPTDPAIAKPTKNPNDGRGAPGRHEVAWDTISIPFRAFSDLEYVFDPKRTVGQCSGGSNEEDAASDGRHAAPRRPT